MDVLENLISEEIIYALGWTVMHSIWQGFLIAIIMAFLLQILQQKSAKIRYEIAAFSMFLVLVSAICTFIWHLDAAEEVIVQEMNVISHSVSEMQVEETTLLYSFTQTCKAYFNTHLPLIVMIWMMGVAFFIMRLFGGLAYIQRLKYYRSFPLSPYWQSKVKTLSAKIPVRKSVQILESAAIKAPMLIGYFKPIILLPLGAINQLNENEVEAIIAHELAHVFRNDFLLNIFLSFIEVFFYYHPAIWWISGNIRLERENCCDDIAIKVCGNSLVYAKALVRIQALNAYTPGFAMPFSGQKNQLLNRIKRILNQPQNRSNIMEKLTATCFLLIAIIFMSVSADNSRAIEERIVIEKLNQDLLLFEMPEIKTVIKEVVISDTIPENEVGEIEMIEKDGEIIKLVIDGKEIPKEDYNKYKEHYLSDKLKIEKNDNNVNSDAMQKSKAFYRFPGNEGIKKQTITKTKNEDGQTIIILKSTDDEPFEIVVDKSGEVILIDGNKLQEGDTSIVIKKSMRWKGINGENFPMQEFRFHEGSKGFEFYADSLVWKKGLSQHQWENELKHKLLFFENEERRALELLERQDELNIEQELEKNLHQMELEKNLKSIVENQKRLNDNLGERNKIYNARILEEMQLKQEGLEQLKNSHAFLYYQDAERFPDRTAQRIVSELRKDGIITDSKNFSFSLTHKKMKVDGKKQSEAVFKKYLKLHHSLTGETLDNKSNFQINYQQD